MAPVTTSAWIRVEAAQLEPPPKLAATIRSPIAFHLFGQPLRVLAVGAAEDLDGVAAGGRDAAGEVEVAQRLARAEVTDADDLARVRDLDHQRRRLSGEESRSGGESGSEHET